MEARLFRTLRWRISSTVLRQFVRRSWLRLLLLVLLTPHLLVRDVCTVPRRLCAVAVRGGTSRHPGPHGTRRLQRVLSLAADDDQHLVGHPVLRSGLPQSGGSAAVDHCRSGPHGWRSTSSRKPRCWPVGALSSWAVRCWWLTAWSIGAPWTYYLLLGPFMIAFAMIPAGLGVIGCLLLVAFAPRWRGIALALVGLLVLAGLAGTGWTALARRSRTTCCRPYGCSRCWGDCRSRNSVCCPVGG